MALALCAIVVGFAAVQSVFGVGLLVFGTPTLLLMGLPFDETLAYLLPSSIAISGLQLTESGGLRLDPFRRRFLVLTAPLVLVGTVVILTTGVGIDIRLVIAAMLIGTGAIRLSARARTAMGLVIRRHLGAFLAGLGAIHGISNLGGGVLTLIAGSVFETREEIRRQIAFCYGAMASIQLATLLVTTVPDVNPWLCVLLPALAALTHLTVGNRTFRAAGQVTYQQALTLLIIAFGIALVLTR